MKKKILQGHYRIIPFYLLMNKFVNKGTNCKNTLNKKENEKKNVTDKPTKNLKILKVA